jgi:hypothetical protein
VAADRDHDGCLVGRRGEGVRTVEPHLALALPSPLKAGATRDNAAAITAWLHAHVRFTGADLTAAPIDGLDLDAVLKRGTANANEIGALLAALLRAAGFTPELVLAHRGWQATFDRERPALSAFDHVLVRVPLATGELWIGGTGLAELATQGGTKILAKILGQQEKIDFSLTPSAARAQPQSNFGKTIYHVAGKNDLCKGFLFFKVCGNSYVGYGKGDGVVPFHSAFGCSAAGAATDCNCTKYAYHSWETRVSGALCIGQSFDHFGMVNSGCQITKAYLDGTGSAVLTSWSDSTSNAACTTTNSSCDDQFAQTAQNYSKKTDLTSVATKSSNTTLYTDSRYIAGPSAYADDTASGAGWRFSCGGKCGGANTINGVTQCHCDARASRTAIAAATTRRACAPAAARARRTARTILRNAMSSTRSKLGLVAALLLVVIIAIWKWPRSHAAREAAPQPQAATREAYAPAAPPAVDDDRPAPAAPGLEALERSLADYKAVSVYPPWSRPLSEETADKLHWNRTVVSDLPMDDRPGKDMIAPVRSSKITPSEIASSVAARLRAASRSSSAERTFCRIVETCVANSASRSRSCAVNTPPPSPLSA